MREIKNNYLIGFVYLFLTVITLTVFWQVCNFEFTDYDDDDYVSKNNHISSGLTLEGIVWVFSNEHGGNWHPLTGLSHMVDCELFGLKPGRHHFVNLLFHIANTLLLFSILRRMTAALWASVFVAALFALHPLHVESVAWISERKDVLSTFFWLLTMVCYFCYVKKPKISTYILSLVFFVLGLMAKPMLVTVPFVLLLLDYWPLNRIEIHEGGRTKWRNWQYLILEKIPFFVFSIISSIVTILVQRSAGAVRELEAFSLTSRISNALVSYIYYIGKMFWPIHLSVYYSHVRDRMLSWQVFGAGILLLTITILVIRFATKYKYLFVGWFWYLVTLVPVIGLVQVGDQGMADRYTYIPLIGLFIAVTWWINALLLNRRHKKFVSGILSIAVLFLLSGLTYIQTGYWRNNSSLFEYALKANNNFCIVFLENGKFYQEAIEVCHRALKTGPKKSRLYQILGISYNKLGRYQEALAAYSEALQIQASAELYNNLAVTYTQLGQLEEAIDNYKLAIRIKPDYAEAYNNIGAIYNQLGHHQDALDVYKHAIRIKSDYANAHYNLGLTYLTVGDSNSALAEYKILDKLDKAKAEQLFKEMHK